MPFYNANGDIETKCEGYWVQRAITVRKPNPISTVVMVAGIWMGSFSEPIRRFLGLSYGQFAAIALVVLAASLFYGLWRADRNARREREAMEQRFAAEDERLFGQSLTSSLR